MARLQGGPARDHEMRGEVSVAAVGRVDSCKLHPFLVVPGVGAGQRNGNKDLSAKLSLLCRVYFTVVMKTVSLNKHSRVCWILETYQISLHDY